MGASFTDDVLFGPLVLVLTPGIFFPEVSDLRDECLVAYSLHAARVSPYYQLLVHADYHVGDAIRTRFLLCRPAECAQAELGVIRAGHRRDNLLPDLWNVIGIPLAGGGDGGLPDSGRMLVSQAVVPIVATLSTEVTPTPARTLSMAFVYGFGALGGGPGAIAAGVRFEGRYGNQRNHLLICSSDICGCARPAACDQS